MRVDFNVPVKNGRVKDDFKIRKALPTIEYLIKQRAQVILMSHLGMLQKTDPAVSLKLVGRYLENLLKQKVAFIPFKLNTNPPLRRDMVQIPDGGVALLENVRFSLDEMKNTGVFARALSRLADVFVFDGFASAHRGTASVSGVAAHLPAYAGLLLFEEITALTKALEKPKRPLVVLLGGAKVGTKIPILKNLLPKADAILISGGIFNTYLWAKGHRVGASLIDPSLKKLVLACCAKRTVVLPVDVLVGDSKGKSVRVEPIVPGQLLYLKKTEGIYDVGPRTVQLFATLIKQARTLLWNGAPGMFEQFPYGYGTAALAHIFAARSKGKAYGIAGGGETIEILEKFDLLDDIDLVSTGGGAMLEFLAGKKLPGLKSLYKS